MNSNTITWMAEQCYGIARGLSKIHQHETTYFRSSGDHPFAPKGPISSRARGGSLELFGRHGDIKPQNVLCFDSANDQLGRPILKITDLGLAEFKTSIANIYRSSSKVSMTAAYRPPEYDTENGKVGQSHDIWALGCLYLEMITWLLGGWKLVQEFEQLRIAETTGPRSPRSTEGTFFKVRSISEDGTWKVVVKPTVKNVSRSVPVSPRPVIPQEYLIRSSENNLFTPAHRQTAWPSSLHKVLARVSGAHRAGDADNQADGPGQEGAYSRFCARNQTRRHAELVY